jgi:oligoendopeptidase F
LATAPETGVESVRWDLDELYASPDDPRIEDDLAEAQRFAEGFEARYRGRLGRLPPAEFLAMMTALEAALEAGARPALYAQLKHSQDTGDQAAGRLLGRIGEAGAQRGGHLVFFSLELAALDDEVVERLAAAPETSRYRHLLERERRHRPHQLSEVEERLLTEVDPVGTVSWTRLYSELCAAIRVSLAGSEVTLAEAITRLRDPDRERRREAAAAITAALDADLRSRAYAFNVVLLDKAIGDRLRRYPSWIADRNLANETSAAAAEALVTAVTGGYGLVARYYRAKRSLLGLDELSEWDRDAPIAEAGPPLSWAEARQIVLEAYESLSPRAADLIGDFFDHGWIDAPPVPGKQSGAYCALGTPGLHPYVLMNFTGHLKDALTLAHELGHGLHYRLAARQHLFNFNPQLVLAETASVFGETLVFDHIMSQERDPAMRLSLLCQQVEDSVQAIFRQVAFNRFEDAVHALRRAEGELSVEQLGEVWQEKLQAMFGDSLRLSPGHANWWSHVEHFVATPGYVYAYAFGKLLALTLYRRWKTEGESFVDAYLDVLAAGGSRSPEETLAGVGVRTEDPEFWNAGLHVIETMVAEVESLARAREDAAAR